MIKIIRDSMDKAFDYYVYLKYCWGRSMSHIGIFTSIIDKVLIFAMFFKIYDLGNPKLILGVSVPLVVGGMIFFGHYDLSLGIAEKEATLRNKYDPQMRLLVERSNGGKRK